MTTNDSPLTSPSTEDTELFTALSPAPLSDAKIRALALAMDTAARQATEAKLSSLEPQAPSPALKANLEQTHPQAKIAHHGKQKSTKHKHAQEVVDNTPLAWLRSHQTLSIAVAACLSICVVLPVIFNGVDDDPPNGVALTSDQSAPNSPFQVANTPSTLAPTWFIPNNAQTPEAQQNAYIVAQGIDWSSTGKLPPSQEKSLYQDSALKHKLDPNMRPVSTPKKDDKTIQIY